jgi:hypothetical protein
MLKLVLPCSRYYQTAAQSSEHVNEFWKTSSSCPEKKFSQPGTVSEREGKKQTKQKPDPHFLPNLRSEKDRCFATGLPDGLLSKQTPSFGRFWKPFERKILIHIMII